ncbi:hypothetical protein [Streptomyces mirabilis]|uniref:LysR substrate binding domain-containing protein n=1 Tax=Streptomyces mirabilis TaxID=68239 RepID=A0ABU3V342_9ACTN|nr:hypothetical protein [Streptomyces mirabilis]MDU9000608.1 hypothetical protein [Streptomyces mirabilis]
MEPGRHFQVGQIHDMIRLAARGIGVTVVPRSTVFGAGSPMGCNAGARRRTAPARSVSRTTRRCTTSARSTTASDRADAHDHRHRLRQSCRGRQGRQGRSTSALDGGDVLRRPHRRRHCPARGPGPTPAVRRGASRGRDRRRVHADPVRRRLDRPAAPRHRIDTDRIDVLYQPREGQAEPIGDSSPRWGTAGRPCTRVGPVPGLMPGNRPDCVGACPVLTGRSRRRTGGRCPSSPSPAA